MNKTAQHTAILVFSLSSNEERNRKNVVGVLHKDKGKKAFDLLINHTKNIVEKCEADIVWFGEKEQKGVTFGERFTNAFIHLFDRGYEKVIAIGNDCPDLSPTLIKKSIDLLNHQNMVLGPTFDGGDYLIGFQKDQFNALLFKELSWNTSGLHNELILLAEMLDLKVVSLKTLVDIDNLKSAKFYIITNPYSTFARELVRLITWINSTSIWVINEAKSIFLSSFLFLRPPPTLYLF